MSQRDLVVLFAASVIPMRPTVQVASSDMLLLLRELTALCLESGASELQRKAAMQALGTGINKWSDGKLDSLTLVR